MPFHHIPHGAMRCASIAPYDIYDLFNAAVS